jgi:hypothetical protein
MSDLREKVASSIGEADKWRATDNSPDWQAAEPAWHAYAHLADAAISICMEEAAKVAKGYHSFPAPTSRAARYHEMHCVKPNIAAAILSLKGGDGDAN